MAALPLRRCAQMASRQALRSITMTTSSSSTARLISTTSFPRFTSSLSRTSVSHTRIALPRPSASVIAARSFSSTPSAREEQDDKPMDAGESNIHDILTAKFKPKVLKVQDVSGGCGSFYSIVIVSSAFKGKSTLAAHRAVNEALKDVIEGIHGLQLKTMPADD